MKDAAITHYRIVEDDGTEAARRFEDLETAFRVAYVCECPRIHALNRHGKIVCALQLTNSAAFVFSRAEFERLFNDENEAFPEDVLWARAAQHFSEHPGPSSHQPTDARDNPKHLSVRDRREV